ncbi:MAG: type II toxin-antitoxin system PemK/MazF family toxin [Actinomycetota bacterium]
MIRRGEVWWANLPDPLGSGPGFRRPILVVQSDSFNRSRIATIVAVVLTSNTRLGEAPGNVVLGRRETGLPKPSVANVSQVVTLDKALLTRRVRALPSRVLQQVDEGLRLVLSL